MNFHPQLRQSLKGYGRATFAADLSAGVTVGIIALPLAMAFGIASGTKPEQGLVTAIIAGILVSVLGGCRLQIAGPAGAFVGLLYGIAQKYGIANLLLCTLFSGVLLIAMGAFKLGGFIRFIPVSVISGFTNGIAVIIAMQQIKDFLGLNITKMPANFFSQLSVLWQAITSINPQALALGLVSIVVLISWPVLAKKISGSKQVIARVIRILPPTLLVIVFGALATHWLKLSIDTIGSRFGGLAAGIPSPQLPEFDWGTVQNLAMPSISIAMLGAIESLMCARLADGLTGDRHDPNQELMAQGIANCVVPLFGGIAATGTIARTVANIKMGAATPVSGVIHSLTLLTMVLFLAPLAQHIPLTSLAAVLLVVAYNMGKWSDFYRLKQFSLGYKTVFLSAFTLTVVFDITIAVEMGLVLACLFFIYRVSSLTHIVAVPTKLTIAPNAQVHIFTAKGALFFGAVGKLQKIQSLAAKTKQWIFIDLANVLTIDTTFLDELESIAHTLQTHQGQLVLMNLNEQAQSLISRAGKSKELAIVSIMAEHSLSIEQQAANWLSSQDNHHDPSHASDATQA